MQSKAKRKEGVAGRLGPGKKNLRAEIDTVKGKHHLKTPSRERLKKGKKKANIPNQQSTSQTNHTRSLRSSFRY